MYQRFIAALPAIDRVLRRSSIVMLAALLIAFPTLFAGFALDDHIHLLTLAGDGYGATPLDLFQFATGEPADMRKLIRGGPFPWYTYPGLKIHFFRPLSSALMAADHVLFGKHAFFYHGHSVLWYALLAWAVALVYRRALAAPVAGLATLLFVLDDSHLIPTLWWSNRNALVAAAPAVLGLAAHLRWREDGWRPGLPLSLLGYAAGLLGGEGALGIMGYLVAYEGLARRDTVRIRLRAVAPALSLAAVYLIGYKLGGYGVSGSGIYIDPVAEWQRYLANVPQRLVELAGAQFFSLPLELAVLSDTLGLALMLTAVAGCALLMALTPTLWRTLSPANRLGITWLGAGALIAVFPALATFPSSRLLALPAMGACAAIALIIYHGANSVRVSGRNMLGGMARFFAMLHLVVAPLAWLAAAIIVPTVFTLSADAFRSMAIDEERAGTQHMITLFAPDPYTGFYPQVMRRSMGLAEGAGWQTLSMAPFDHEVTRTAENQFEMRVLGGQWLSTPFERLMRGPQHPLEAGDGVNMGEYTIVVLDSGAWGPSRIQLTFAHPLEHTRYHFLAWRDGQLREFRWPRVGDSTILRTSDGYFAMRS